MVHRNAKIDTHHLIVSALFLPSQVLHLKKKNVKLILSAIYTQFLYAKLQTAVLMQANSSHTSMRSATNWLATWACSPGGPGRNLDEHRGGRSTFGTVAQTANLNFIQQEKTKKSAWNNDACPLTNISLIRSISSGHGQFLCKTYVESVTGFTY